MSALFYICWRINGIGKYIALLLHSYIRDVITASELNKDLINIELDKLREQQSTRFNHINLLVNEIKSYEPKVLI